jgi:KRAB domain-containing zinc finger protein
MSCVAPNCTGRYRRGTKVGYYRIPSDYKRKQLWLKALGKDSWEPKSYHRVCGAHFVSGRPSLDPSDVDFVPNVFNLIPKTEPMFGSHITNDLPPSTKGKKSTSDAVCSFAMIVAAQNDKPGNSSAMAVKSSVVKDVHTNTAPFKPRLVHKPVIESTDDDKRDLRPRFISKSTQTVPVSNLFMSTVRHQPNHMVFMDKSTYTSEDIFLHEIQSLQSQLRILETRLATVETQQRKKESVFL